MSAQENLCLRALEMEDVETIYGWENDMSQWNIGSNLRFLSRYAVEDYIINSQNEEIFSCGQARFILEKKEGERRLSVGCVDLFDIDGYHSKAAIGLYIDQSHRGQGLADKALQLLENYSFEVLHLHQIYAFIGEGNTSCRRLFEHSNYKEVASLPDWIRKKDGYENVIVYNKIFTPNNEPKQQQNRQ